MQNCKSFNRLIFQFMRIGLLPIILVMLLVGVSYAKPADGQDVLKKKITLDANQEQIKLVLRQISKKADVKFVYIAPKIQDRKRVSLFANDEELGKILDRLLSPFNIKYEVIDDQIILKSIASQTGTEAG
jgi:TonB-dependent starch-binding outer membrane protein SusC